MAGEAVWVPRCVRRLWNSGGGEGLVVMLSKHLGWAAVFGLLSAFFEAALLVGAS